MGFRNSNIGKRDTRITVSTPSNPNAAQGYYDEFGEEVTANQTDRRVWVELVDRPSIGPIVGGQIQDEIEHGLMGDSRSIGELTIFDTITIDRFPNQLYQVVDVRDTNYRFTSLILVRRHAK